MAVAFSKEGAGRIVDATRYVERAYKNSPAVQTPGPSTPLRVAYLAFTGSTGVPAATGTAPGTITPGSASVTVAYFDGTSITASTTTLTAWNSTSSAVGGNKLVQIKYIDGYWWVDVESC